MTVVARLQLRTEADDGDYEAVADAVDAVGDFDVAYETTLMTSVIEGPSVPAVTAAARVAYEAVESDWTVASIEIDCQPDRDGLAADGAAPPDDDGGTSPDRPYV